MLKKLKLISTMILKKKEVIKIEELEEKAFFNFGSSEYYEGYHLKSRKWNGFATPGFEKNVADKIAHNCTTKDTITIKYDAKNDCYIIKEFQDGKVYSTEKIYKSTVQTKDGTKELYDIGSFSWVWLEFSLDEIKDDPDANIVYNNNNEKENILDFEY